MKHNVPIQSLIDHIKTAIDIDPWAKEMVEELLKAHQQIVRCKDCKFYIGEGHFCKIRGLGRALKPDDFCCDAKRN